MDRRLVILRREVVSNLTDLGALAFASKPFQLYEIEQVGARLKPRIELNIEAAARGLHSSD